MAEDNKVWKDTPVKKQADSGMGENGTAGATKNGPVGPGQSAVGVAQTVAGAGQTAAGVGAAQTTLVSTVSVTQDTASKSLATPQATPKPSQITSNISEINREFQEKSTLKHAGELGLPYINIGKTPLNPDFLKLTSIDLARRARIIPFFRVGKKVRVAVEDPQNPETKKAVQSLQERGYEISLNLASNNGIDDALKIYDQTQKYKKIDIVDTVEEKSIKTYEKEIAALADLSKKLDTVTAEEALNLLNIGAMKTGASDAHYEPQSDAIRVRFRIDGVLHKVFTIKHETYKNLANQIKYESRMQLNVTTVPQDGRYSFVYNNNTIAVRVSSIPTPYGESFVCRFLPSSDKPLTFEELGFQGLSLTKLKKACEISHGMILSTGPTGSGKTTTLYAILKVMNTPENKIITLEDPVEYSVEGVTQSQIDEKRNYNFAGGLRAILRQDPDTIMLGEIRDLETAETAAQAALTGHILLSTLHTNSAIETIPRLRNMGLAPFMIAPALNTLIAQRLLRKVCPNCSKLETISASELKEFKEIVENLKKINSPAAFDIPEKIAKVYGCEACSQTGYKGRMVIAEVITVTEEIKSLILNNASLVDLITAARKEGIMTMREDGFWKVSQGFTTLEEVYRVTNVVD